MKNYVKSLDPNEIVCFVDAFDVVILSDPKEIENKFLTLVKNDLTKILVSKEIYSEHNIENFIISSCLSIAYKKCKSNYINSGTYIGTASTVLKVLNGVFNEFKGNPAADDQRRMQEYCSNHSDEFVIDTDSSLFLVMNSMLSKINQNEHGISFNENKFVYKNNIYPSIFHGNGFTNFDYIIEKLGYDTEIFKAEYESKSKFVISRFLDLLPLLFEKLWIYFLIIILCIYFLIKYIIYIIYNKVIFKKYK